MKIAEVFVADNGFTNSPARADQFRPDPVQEMFGEPQDAVLASGKGVLTGRAHGFARGNETWEIYFPFSTPRLDGPRPLGKVVAMDACGHDVRMVHQEGYLDAARALSPD